jgi:hypothetical protein
VEEYNFARSPVFAGLSQHCFSQIYDLQTFTIVGFPETIILEEYDHVG